MSQQPFYSDAPLLRRDWPGAAVAVGMSVLSSAPALAVPGTGRNAGLAMGNTHINEHINGVLEERGDIRAQALRALELTLLPRIFPEPGEIQSRENTWRGLWNNPLETPWNEQKSGKEGQTFIR